MCLLTKGTMVQKLLLQNPPSAWRISYERRKFCRVYDDDDYDINDDEMKDQEEKAEDYVWSSGRREYQDDGEVEGKAQSEDDGIIIGR